jgi:hypothetical protein
VLLPAELQGEKQRLLQEAFDDWSKSDFQNFHRACGKYGRLEFEKIAKDVNKSVADVKRYSEAFWNKGKDVISNFDTVVKNIEKVCIGLTMTPGLFFIRNRTNTVYICSISNSLLLHRARRNWRRSID